MEVLGYSAEELRNLTLHALLHPADLTTEHSHSPWIDRQTIKDGAVNRCRHKNGTYRSLRWHVSKQSDRNATYAIAVEVADQILFEANPNPMWVYDRDSLRFLEINDAAVEHYGYTRAEFLSMTLLDIRPATDSERVRESVRRHPADEAPHIWTHLLKGGEPIQVEVLVRNIEYQGYHARLASIKDVTEQQKARAQLQHNNELLEHRVAERTQELVAANTELEAFCFSVSHDLRAPLRAIDGFSHAVIKHYGHAMGADGRADLERVRRASQKMSELIDALLGLARLTRQELRRQVVDLSAMARQVNEELCQENPTRTVRCQIQSGLEVSADPRLMHLLLQNLFSNAWKFTADVPDAEIAFQAQPTGGELLYSIRDNGAGFDMAYADKLFHPFQRLHHTSEFAGNGVGLATVKRIVSRHGGRTFAHGLINHGATVYFTLSPNGAE